MKIRTLQLLVKEGSYNVYKNKLMSFASILTVVAALFFLGIVLLITVNITSNIEAMKRDLEVIVFLKTSVTAMERAEVISFIEQQQEAGTISQYREETREQAFENLRSIVKNDALLKGLALEHVPESYYIKLANPDLSEGLITKLYTFKGVNTDYGIGYDKHRLDDLKGMLKVFNYIMIALLIALMIVSVFLISNTIRLTVFARRKEIEIMKYVGALDSFIRWPFIVEGFIIGLVGAIVSFFLTSQAYTWLQNAINSILSYLSLFTLKIIPFGPFALNIFLIYTIFGVVIGGIGSFMSVRKHLNV